MPQNIRLGSVMYRSMMFSVVVCATIATGFLYKTRKLKDVLRIKRELLRSMICALAFLGVVMLFEGAHARSSRFHVLV